MIEKIIDIEIRKSDLRKFGITVGMVLLIICGIFYWGGKESNQLFFAIGIIFFLTGISIPILIKPIYWAWMVFSIILGWFIIRVISILLFYAIFTPIGLFARLFGKQFLELNWNHSQYSYWNKITHETLNKK